MSKPTVDKLSVIAGESIIQFLGSAARVPLVYALTVILTRGLGLDYYGLWALGESVQRILLTLILLGMPKALYRFIAYYQGAGEPGKTKNLIIGGAVFSIFISIIVLLMLLFTPASTLDQIFREEGIGRLLRLMAVGLPFYALLLLLSSCYIGLKKARYQVLTEVVGLPLVQIILALIIFKGFNQVHNIAAWAWTYASALCIVSLMSLLLFVRKVWSSILKTVQRRPVEYRAIISYAWPLTINAILTLMIGREVDLLLLGTFGSARDVGIYRIYLYFVMPLQMIVTSLARIYQPVVTELVAQRELADLASVFRRVAKWTLQINMFLALAIVFLGETLVLALFGEEYLIAPTALSILAMGTVLDSSVGPTLMTLEAFGRSRLVLFNSVLVIVLQVGLAYFLIPRLGLVGAAIARAFAVSLTNYIELGQVWVFYKLLPFASAYGWSLLIGLFALAVGSVTQLWLQSESRVLSMLIAFLLSALVYLGGLLISGVADQEDRRIIRGLFKRFRVKLI